MDIKLECNEIVRSKCSQFHDLIGLCDSIKWDYLVSLCHQGKKYDANGDDDLTLHIDLNNILQVLKLRRMPKGYQKKHTKDEYKIQEKNSLRNRGMSSIN